MSGGIELANITTTGNNQSQYYPGDYDFTVVFSLGYAFNEREMLTFDRSMSVRKKPLDGTTSLFMSADGNNWYHYFSKDKKSFYSVIGSLITFDTFIIGGGYLFDNNIQVDIRFTDYTTSGSVNHIRLLISYVAF